MNKTQIFYSTDPNTLVRNMNAWFAEHSNAKVVALSQSSVPQGTNPTRPLTTITVVYTEKVSGKGRKPVQLNG